jgi:predicted nucleotidyltransferase
MGKGSGGKCRPELDISSGLSISQIESVSPCSYHSTHNLCGKLKVYPSSSSIVDQTVNQTLNHKALSTVSVGALWLSGSRAYETDHPDSDVDLRGLWVYPPEDVYGMYAGNPTIEVPEGDITLYELGKLCSMASKSNPNALELLWSPLLAESPLGRELIQNRPLFLSRRITHSYNGYAWGQLEFVRTGRGGTRGKNHLKRQKHLLHLFRLQTQCLRAIQTGELQMAIEDPEELRAWAQEPLDEIESRFKSFETKIQESLTDSPLPEAPDQFKINQLVIRLRKASLQGDF